MLFTKTLLKQTHCCVHLSSLDTPSLDMLESALLDPIRLIYYGGMNKQVQTLNFSSFFHAFLLKLYLSLTIVADSSRLCTRPVLIC